MTREKKLWLICRVGPELVRLRLAREYAELTALWHDTLLGTTTSSWSDEELLAWAKKLGVDDPRPGE